MTDHAELRRLAALAHPDAEWFIARNLDHQNIDKPAASFIATATPKTVLALLDEIDRLKAENDELRRLCSCAKQYDLSMTLRRMIDAAIEGAKQ